MSDLATPDPNCGCPSRDCSPTVAPVRCIHCGEGVETTAALGGGTVWIHGETWMVECEPTYAAPMLEDLSRKGRADG